MTQAQTAIEWIMSATADGGVLTVEDYDAARAVELAASHEDATVIRALVEVHRMEAVPETWPADTGTAPGLSAALDASSRPAAPECPPAVSVAVSDLWDALETGSAPDVQRVRRVMRAHPDHQTYLAHLLGLTRRAA